MSGHCMRRLQIPKLAPFLGFFCIAKDGAKEQMKCLCWSLNWRTEGLDLPELPLRMWFIVGLMLFCTILSPLKLGSTVQRFNASLRKNASVVVKVMWNELKHLACIGMYRFRFHTVSHEASSNITEYSQKAQSGISKNIYNVTTEHEWNIILVLNKFSVVSVWSSTVSSPRKKWLASDAKLLESQEPLPSVP